jgi:hypothetical protein
MKLTQRRKDAKRMKPDPSGSQNSDRSQPARETFFPCIFAPLRLCAFALKPGGGAADTARLRKKDECGFLPKAATPGGK